MRIGAITLGHKSQGEKKQLLIREIRRPHTVSDKKIRTSKLSRSETEM